MQQDIKFLIKIVKQASKLVNHNFKTNLKDENNDLVTTLDLEIENFLISKLNKQYPNFKIISEEFNSNQTKELNYFTIDPIDGTINFANRLPLWGIQIAMVKNGKTCACVLYFPALNELFYADQTGAYNNGKLLNLHTSNVPSSLLIDQFYMENEHKFIEAITGKVPNHLRSRTIRKMYCASLTYCWIASGKFGALVFANDLPWDYTPGQYLVEKANGVTTTLNHNNKNYYIAAVNQQFLNKIVNTIKTTQ